MWVIKGLLFLVLLVVLVTFFLNNDQTVSINLLGRIYELALFWVLLVAYVLGFASCLIVWTIRELRLHAQLRRLRHTVQQKDKEIINLRTLPLQDLPAEDVAEENIRG